MRDRLMRCVVPAAAVAAIFSACDRSPTGLKPSTPTVSQPVRLEIHGPREVPPAATAQLRAEARFADGSTRDVTTLATWRSAVPSVLSFSQPGLARGHQPGDALVSAVFNSASTARELIVTPAGTYRLTGRVSEAGNPDVAIADAAIEVPAGSALAGAARTGSDGRYRLFGVPGVAQIRISREGYNPHTETVILEDHATRDFELGLLRPRPDYAGTYTLTVTAASECAAELPEPARTRRYTAVLTQSGPGLQVALSGASFVVLKTGQGSRLSGSVDEAGATFRLTQYDWYYKGYGQPYADLVEMIDPSLFLVVDGVASVVGSAAGLSGRLSGSLHVFDGDPRWGPTRTARCSSERHAFVLSR